MHAGIRTEPAVSLPKASSAEHSRRLTPAPLDPAKQGYPAAANRSLIEIGNPWGGPTVTPAEKAASAAAATARACSGAHSE